MTSRRPPRMKLRQRRRSRRRNRKSSREIVRETVMKLKRSKSSHSSIITLMKMHQ